MSIQFAALQRTVSLPFKAGKHKQCAVKVEGKLIALVWQLV